MLKIKRREENQLDATECFIALLTCSTCFGHLYAHHQELETILVLSTHMVCNALVAGGRLLGAEQQAMCLGRGKSCDTLKFLYGNKRAQRPTHLVKKQKFFFLNIAATTL